MTTVCWALALRSSSWLSSGCSSIWLTAGVTNVRSIRFSMFSAVKLDTPIDRAWPSPRD
ncbi:Uncharacterised protein [Mycobacterium tuberculosis]|nr:Uncharacterised protein [Mycobacterium tuberculosis]